MRFANISGIGGDFDREAIVSNLLGLFNGNVPNATRLLWLPKGTDTTTTTDESRNQETFTYDATIASRLSSLGGGYAVDFDGTDDEADVADSDLFSFGDGASDDPFSVVALVNPDTISGTDMIVAKYDATSGSTKYEYIFDLTSGIPTLRLVDQNSSSNWIGRKYGSALTVSTWALMTATYDGTSSASGIRHYKDGIRVDTADDSANTYVAMENSSAPFMIAHVLNSSSAPTNFFDGKMAMIALIGRELSADDNWTLKNLVNSYFDLTL